MREFDLRAEKSRFNIPENYFADAVRFFWQQRSQQASSGRGGEGERQSVTGGKHLDGVLTAIVTLLTRHDVPTSDIFARCSLHDTGKLELPGYFRATKEWDLLVIREGRLLAALELKAQVGPSFGNNVNNRTEEALGSAEHVWTAYRQGAFSDSGQPWLGYFFCWRTIRGQLNLSETKNRTLMYSQSSAVPHTQSDMNYFAGG